MQKLTLTLFATLLSLGTHSANERMAPEKLVASAVAKVPACDYTALKVAIDKRGRKRKVKANKEDNHFSEKLTLPLLFREKRFKLAYGADHWSLEGKRALVVNFTPQEKSFQLEPGKSESDYANHVMNNLEGSLYLDPESGEIMRVQASLSEKLFFDWHGLRYAELESVEFLLEQVPIGGKWLPLLIEMTLKYWKVPVFHFDVHDRYTVSFQCST